MLAAVSVLCVLAVQNASALTLEESIAAALKSNPQIGQAIENRRATEWELRQARGSFFLASTSKPRQALANWIARRAVRRASSVPRSILRKSAPSSSSSW
jgi:hypothetical protein